MTFLAVSCTRIFRVRFACGGEIEKGHPARKASAPQWSRIRCVEFELSNFALRFVGECALIYCPFGFICSRAFPEAFLFSVTVAAYVLGRPLYMHDEQKAHTQVCMFLCAFAFMCSLGSCFAFLPPRSRSTFPCPIRRSRTHTWSIYGS